MSISIVHITSEGGKEKTKYASRSSNTIMTLVRVRSKLYRRYFRREHIYPKYSTCGRTNLFPTGGVETERENYDVDIFCSFRTNELLRLACD